MAKSTGLTGIGIFRSNTSRLKSDIKASINEAIELRTRQMYEDLDVAMSGKYPGRHTRTNAASGQKIPGSGLDVPGASLEVGMIGEFTGRMRNALRSTVNHTKFGSKGQIGFGKEYRSYGGAANNAIQWPKKPVSINVVTSPPITPEDDTRKLGDEDPSEYIPQVLLGTASHVGRNILRLAIFEDIKDERTLKTIEAYVKKVTNKG
jgi:hypothetical protein